MIIERIGEQSITELVEQSAFVADVVCPHPDRNMPDAVVASIYRAPAGTQPYTFLVKGNDQRVFDDSRAVTLVSRVHLVARPGQRRPAHWEIQCELCGFAGVHRYGQAEPSRTVTLRPVNLARLGETLEANGIRTIRFGDLQRAITG